MRDRVFALREGGNRRERLDQRGNLRSVGIADHEGDAGEGGNFFRRALGVTAGNDDARGGIGGMDFADGVAGLGIGRSSDGAGVEHDHVGGA